MKALILVAAILFGAWISPAQSMQTDTTSVGSRTDFAGVYSTGPDLAGTSITLTNDHRFQNICWGDLTPEETSSGRWEEAGFPNVIRLFSDLPRGIEASIDSTLSGCKFVVHGEDQEMFPFPGISVRLNYADTTVYVRLTDSINLVKCGAPFRISAGGDSYFNVVFNAVDTAQDFQKSFIDAPSWEPTVMTTGPQSCNVFDIFLQEKTLVYKGDTCIIFDEHLCWFEQGLMKYVPVTQGSVHGKDPADSIVGLYKKGVQVLDLGSDNRFMACGLHTQNPKLGFTTGRWEQTTAPGVIRLFSDNRPRVPVVKTDSSSKDFTLVLKLDTELTQKWNLIDVSFFYQDTSFEMRLDSGGTIHARLDSLLKVEISPHRGFFVSYFVNQPGCQIAADQERRHSPQSIIAFGDPSQNVLEVTLQEEFEACNGDAFCLYKGTLYPLYGWSREGKELK